MLVLGIETSCDETGVGVVENGRRILGNVVSSQVEIHARYGGVVPELASRNHVAAIRPVTEQCLNAAGVSLKDVSAIAVTAGPGLVGSLLVGLSFAKALAYVCGVPLVVLHHLEGHIYSAFLLESPPEFPFVSLVVSGGHSTLILCIGHMQFRILGRTRDDAVGEAFDKVSKLLGLGYPGGPIIENKARGGDPTAFKLPRPLINEGLDFSFSGLKTAVLYCLDSLDGSPKTGQRGRAVSTTAQLGDVRRLDERSAADLCASFQGAVLDVLARKARRALEETGCTRLVLCGGVAANTALRQAVEQAISEVGGRLFAPPPALCIDNGAMVAAAGYHKRQLGVTASLAVGVDANLALEERIGKCKMKNAK